MFQNSISLNKTLTKLRSRNVYINLVLAKQIQRKYIHKFNFNLADILNNFVAVEMNNKQLYNHGKRFYKIQIIQIFFSRVKRRKSNKIIRKKTSRLSSGAKAFKHKSEKLLQLYNQQLRETDSQKQKHTLEHESKRTIYI